MSLFVTLHRGQARAYRIAQRALLRRIDEASTADEKWVMPEDMRKELAEISGFLSKSSVAMVQIHDANTKVTEGLSTELLEAQLRSEFVMAARTFTDEEWRVLDEIRAQRDARKAAQA